MTGRGNPPDAPWKPAGTGMAQTFLCARCSTFKGILGRRKQRVRGVQQWVCAGCVQPVEARVAA